jgi:hypothetical protein
MNDLLRGGVSRFSLKRAGEYLIRPGCRVRVDIEAA